MTDIVGSTALVTRLGEAYIDVVRRHRALLIDVFTSHGGRVVDDTGDACFAVFDDAGQAVLATLAAQRTVATEQWPEDAVIGFVPASTRARRLPSVTVSSALPSTKRLASGSSGTSGTSPGSSPSRPDSPADVRNRLPVLRAERGWTQADLAARLEVSRQTVVSIEKGKYDPSLPLAFKIAQLFDLRIEDVFQPNGEAEAAAS